MRPSPAHRCALLVPLALWLVLAGPRARAGAAAPADPASALAPLAPSGLLVDRVLPLARLERLDGHAGAPAADGATWRQAWSELARARFAPADTPGLAAIDASARATRAAGVLPLAFLDRAYERVRPGAIADGALRLTGERLVVDPDRAPLVSASAVVAAVLAPPTRRGGDVAFALDPERCDVDGGPPRALSIDFADGHGPREVALGERVRVHYASPGPRELTLRATRADGSIAEARAAFTVAAVTTPAPDETLHVTASVPWNGQHGTGDAYVDLAPGHTGLVNPVVVIEGFDIDNSMNWDELYALLDQQGLIETLRADGFDAVVLNFTDATLPVEENGLVVSELLQQVQALVPPTTSLALVGASMGGLCSRYALDWLESHGVPHRVRTWISFDGPQAGADIPLGLQYWIGFFASQSTSAADFLTALNSPAAREMLLYHLTTPASPTAAADPLRDSLAVHLAALGGWPRQPRRVAIANGSGTAQSQGFAPAAQLIRYEYSSLFVAITGDVWAVPNLASATIFNGSQRVLFSTTTQKVTVANTLPWDGAPGGSRASMAELDTTSVPYGDIVALDSSHCFIPTISSLALATTDPFFDVATAPNLSTLTPFDAIYWPTANQAHVTITPENAVWLRAEIEAGIVGVPASAGAGALALAASPNPSAGRTRLAFTLAQAGPVRLDVFDLGGRAVRTLARGAFAAGTHEAAWDGRDASGRMAPPGVYLARLEWAGSATTRRIVRLR